MASLQELGPLLALAGSLTLVACAGTRGTQQSLDACRGHANGGGFTVRGEHELVYAISRDSAGAQLDAAVVVRASQAWLRRPPPESRPAAMPRAVNGASAGPLRIGHEPATGTVWLDSVPVPLHNDNALLLEVGDDDAPRIVGRARVEPRLHLTAGSCDQPRTREEAEIFEQTLWAAVRRASLVRAFLDR